MLNKNEIEVIDAADKLRALFFSVYADVYVRSIVYDATRRMQDLVVAEAVRARGDSLIPTGATPENSEDETSKTPAQIKAVNLAKIGRSLQPKPTIAGSDFSI